jgi:hypothetical protein
MGFILIEDSKGNKRLHDGILDQKTEVTESQFKVKGSFGLK